MRARVVPILIVVNLRQATHSNRLAVPPTELTTYEVGTN